MHDFFRVPTLRGSDHEMSRFFILGSALTVATAMAACSTPESATSLDPSGPPKVRQVFMTENIIDSPGNPPQVQSALAFGDHPDMDRINPMDDRTVTDAYVQVSNKIRIVVGRLLV